MSKTRTIVLALGTAFAPVGAGADSTVVHINDLRQTTTNTTHLNDLHSVPETRMAWTDLQEVAAEVTLWSFLRRPLPEEIPDKFRDLVNTRTYIDTVSFGTFITLVNEKNEQCFIAPPAYGMAPENDPSLMSKTIDGIRADIPKGEFEQVILVYRDHLHNDHTPYSMLVTITTGENGKMKCDTILNSMNDAAPAGVKKITYPVPALP